MEEEESVRQSSSVKIIIKDNKISAENLVVIIKNKHEGFAIVAL